MATSTKRKIASLDDLQPAPYNPRRIDSDALKGLAASVEKFGDISGIVWNDRTGHIVAGHQRLRALVDKGAVLDADIPAIRLGDRVFPIRIVSWDDKTEQAANIAANNPALQGEFSENLPDILDDLRDWQGFDDVRLDSLFEQERLPETAEDQSASLLDNWQILIDCSDENEQVVLLEKLQSQGISCRALI